MKLGKEALIDRIYGKKSYLPDGKLLEEWMLTLDIDKGVQKGPEKNLNFDVIIIGAGPAGLTAAIYASRALLKTLVIEKLGSGGQAAVSDLIENYPGFPDGINGFELSQRMEQQAKKFGALFENDEIKSVEKPEGSDYFIIKGESAVYQAGAVLISTGSNPRLLNVKGESAYMGRGISTCATCDAALYREKIVAVVGGGDSAMDEGMFLTRFAKKVIIIHRRNELRAEKILRQKALANPKMEFVWDSVVEEVMGDEKIRRVLIRNVKTNETKEIEIDGLFIYIGHIPNTAWIKVEKDPEGYIITDEMMKTNIPGIFAAGDCRKTPLRQISTAIRDGAIAGCMAEKYLEDIKCKEK